MSNHYSAANLKFPGDDARLDCTDLYVFPAPGEPGTTVLVIDANPYTTGMSAMPPFLMKPEFHPDGIYRINIDTDGDAQADAAFTITFSELKDGTQTGTAYYATGPEARQPEPGGTVLIAGTPVGFDASARPVQAGPVRLFAGVRSDPFFADADGSFHGFKWTGQDAFANRNIQCIALEVPSDMLSTGPVIGVWATVSVRRDGDLVQVDRDGYSPDEAEAAARIVLPDILRYDRTRPAAYPNGRTLTDDCFSARFAWLTNGRVGPDGLKPHDDLLTEFPYLGVPNVYPV